MTIRFSTPFFYLAFFCSLCSLHAQDFAVEMDSSQAQVGKIVCVPVYAHGFNQILGYQYSLEFNEQVLTYHHSQHYNLPDMSSNNFNLYLPGVITTAWTDPVATGVSRVDGAILYEVCFTAVGSVGSSTAITPGGTLPPVVGGANVYGGGGVDLWDPNHNIPGFVEINLAAATKEAGALENAAFQLSPNPTQGATQLQYKAAKTGSAILSVSDASGRTVMEQKVSVKSGDNVFEIPAKVLNAKGIYQVTLQTEEGSNSQMLSVN